MGQLSSDGASPKAARGIILDDRNLAGSLRFGVRQRAIAE
jgi:hypothetical protein